jgi:hypothetical protein
MFKEVATTLDEQLYPDLATRGGFAAAFQLELRRVGSSLVIGEDDSLPILWPSIRHGDRSCQVLLAAKERNFSLSCWHRGVEYGNGWTPDLGALAQFFRDFLEHHASLPTLESSFPWFRASEGGSIHERSPAAYVENRWKQYESRDPALLPDPELRPLILDAGKYPALRQLLPFTSLNHLCFSRTIGYPFGCKGCPHAFPRGNDLYRVCGPSRDPRTGEEADHIIGEGNATQAANWLAGAIPQNWGPAIDGTEDDLPL